MGSFKNGQLIFQKASTATAAGTTTLVNNSKQIQIFTGTTTQTIKLPVATTMSNGQFFRIYNSSTGSLTIQYQDASAFSAPTILTGAYLIVTLTDNSTSNGVWVTEVSGGSVTSVTFTGDGVVLSSTPSSAVTTSGTVAASLRTQTAGTFLAGPTSGSAAAPTFRALQVPTTVLYKYPIFTFTVTAANATVGATYTNNSQTFTVRTTISGGTSLIAELTSGTTATPAASGTLTKASGTGDATITFSSNTQFASYVSAVGALYIKVRGVAGGGGGSGVGTGGSGGQGGSGGNTFFGSSIASAGGGVGASQGSSGGAGGTATINSYTGTTFTGGAGSAGIYTGTVPSGEQNSGGIGGISYFGGAGAAINQSTGGSAVANSGSGGAGGGINAQSNIYLGTGGGAGGYFEFILPAGTYPLAVGGGGTAGTAGTSGNAGGMGGSGYTEIIEYYQ